MTLIGRTIKERYRLENRLGKGGWSEVFLALDGQTGRNVVVKVHDSNMDISHTDDILRFQREAITLVELQHDHIVRLLDYGEDEGTYFLVMENDDGISLHRYLTAHDWPSISEVVRLMVQISGALEYVHRKGIIHQDLKPSNIILHQSRINHGKIVDFGCVMLNRLLHRSQQRMIMGTFPYISPEQLGAHGGRIDARSDLYSLGVMLFELLSGTRPFSPGTTPVEVQRGKHQKFAAPSSINPLVPEVLDRITLKLISYDPEERYQSADGLQEDLEHYQRLSTRTIGAPFFSIGKRDDRSQLGFTTPFIGRDEEIDLLRKQLPKVMGNKGSFILLGGETGFGKSRLLEELRGFAHTLDCVFLLGKCTDTASDWPYFSLIQLFHDYLEYLVTLSAAESKPHYQMIREHFAAYYAELSDLVPAMVKNITPQPGADPQDSSTRMPRFLERIGRFFMAVAQRTKPIVIVFEDIHWADPGTLQLLQILASLSTRESRLMIVASYRTEEVEERPSLKSLLHHLENSHPEIRFLYVSPLPPPKVMELVGTIFSEDSDDFDRLSQTLLEFSRGNPLFIIETIRALMDEEIIVKSNGRWQISGKGRLQPVIGTSLAGIILRRIKNLSEQCKTLLSIASCMGRSFSRQLLVEVMDPEETIIDPLLEEATCSRLILRQNANEGNDYSFTHDKIYETFYDAIAKDKRTELHLRIAHILEAKPETDPRKNVYALAHHFSRGGDLTLAFEYTLQSGAMAKKSLAMHQAADFFNRALELLLAFGHPDLREIDIRENLADACSLTGDYDKAIENYNWVKAAIHDKARRAAIDRKLGGVYTRRGQMPKAVEHFITGLRSLRGGLAKGKIMTFMSGLIYYAGLIFSRFMPTLTKLVCRRRNREELAELVNLYQLSSFPLFWLDVHRSFESQMKNRFYSELLGKSSELARAYANHGIALFRVGQLGLALRSLDKGRRICLEIEDDLSLGNNLCFHGMVLQYSGRNREAIDLFEQAIILHERVGALFELELEYTTLGQSYRHLGYLDKSCEFMMKSKEIAESVNDYRGIGDAYYELAEYFACINNFQEARQNIALCFEYIDEIGNPLLYSIAQRVLGKILIREGKLEQATIVLEDSKRVAAGRWFLGEYMLDTFLFLGEAYIGLLESDPNADAAEKKRLLSLAAANLKQCRSDAKLFQNFIGPTMRLEALIEHHAGRPARAKRLFADAVETLRRQERKYELANTLMMISRLSLDRDARRSEDMAAEANELYRWCNVRIRNPEEEEKPSLVPRHGSISDMTTAILKD